MFPGREWGPSYLSFLVSEFLVSYEAIKTDRDKICEDLSRSWMIRPWQGQSCKRIACRVDMLLERCAKSFVLKILEENCKIIKSPAICPIKKGISETRLAWLQLFLKHNVLTVFCDLVSPVSKIDSGYCCGGLVFVLARDDNGMFIWCFHFNASF